MIEINEKENCCGCSSCAQACPTKAITMRWDEEGFAYPNVEIDKCINCGKCESVCPVLHPAEVSKKTDVYAAYRTDFEERLKSQSGGVFAVLAKSIIQHNGIVCGAAFDESWNLHHCFAENEYELQAQRGSKYVQSEIRNTFAEAKRFLEQGRSVLFSGTPCQIQGLKKYLGREYKNLLTVDLICHGVPSPAVWNRYLQEFLRGQELEHFIQKNKQKNNVIEYHLKNGKVREESYENNLYSKAFYKNLFLRLSCHACRFKGVERCSDITIGDFWGIENFHPDFYDKYGISAVLVHTEKGRELFKKVKPELKCISATVEMLLAQNPCVVESSIASDERSEFFENWKIKGVIHTINDIYHQTIEERASVWVEKKWNYLMELEQAVKRRIAKLIK